MRIVSLKEDYAFKEFMSNEIVRNYFLSATLGVPVEQTTDGCDAVSVLAFWILI